MALQPTARNYYQRQRNLAALAVRRARAQRSLQQVMATVALYQAESANLAATIGPRLLVEQDADPDGPSIAPAAFTLSSTADTLFAEVADDRARTGRLVATLVSDAGRSAMGVFTASRRDEYGHIRQLTPPSCQRCAVLAGRWYRWSTAFQRHPHCDCVMVPGPRSAAQFAPSPDDLYRSGQITDLTRAQRQAIDDGADISQVVNAYRGMTRVNFAGRTLRATTEGTTVRGIAGARLGSLTKVPGERYRRSAVTRLTPESIYDVAADREDAIRLLRLHGYIL